MKRKLLNQSIESIKEITNTKPILRVGVICKSSYEKKVVAEQIVEDEFNIIDYAIGAYNTTVIDGINYRYDIFILNDNIIGRRFDQIILANDKFTPEELDIIIKPMLAGSMISEEYSEYRLQVM